MHASGVIPQSATSHFPSVLNHKWKSRSYSRSVTENIVSSRSWKCAGGPPHVVRFRPSVQHHPFLNMQENDEILYNKCRKCVGRLTPLVVTETKTRSEVGITWRVIVRKILLLGSFSTFGFCLKKKLPSRNLVWAALERHIGFFRLLLRSYDPLAGLWSASHPHVCLSIPRLTIGQLQHNA